MSSSALFILGTRGSPLALAQANETRRRLAEAHGWEIERIALKIIRTTGDTIQDRPLAEAGGKGLFTREIDTALIAGEIDAAVHSAKDLPALPARRRRARGLPAARGRARRADLGLRRPDRGPAARRELRRRLAPPAGAGVAAAARSAGSSSLRGNVETRLRKAESGEIGATLLAMAGLKRLGLADRARAPLAVDAFLPAPARGDRADRARRRRPRLDALEAIADATAFAELAAERAFLAELEGSCRTPIAALGRAEGGRLTFTGEVLRTDGSESFTIKAEGPSGDADRLGREAGRELARRLPAGVLASA